MTGNFLGVICAELTVTASEPYKCKKARKNTVKITQNNRLFLDAVTAQIMHEKIIFI